MSKTAIVGLGNMGLALAEGLLNSKIVTPAQLIGVELSKERADFVAKKLGIKVSDNYTVLSKADIIILAVKPQSMGLLLKQIKSVIKNPLIISIAAGITVDFLKKYLGEKKKIVRTMPNTPALVGSGVTGVYCTENVTAKDKQLVEKILAALGEVVVVDKEDDIDKITALSGSGPAYVYYFMEALEEAGVFIGLSRDTARKLVSATFSGSAVLLKETKKSSVMLKEMVTSPAGTTIAGLYCLEKGAVRGAVLEAVMAAYKRAKELGSN